MVPVLFNRGLTQVLSVCTRHTGMPKHYRMTQMDLRRSVTYIITTSHHTGGETKPMRAPGRREIGHGALAERALPFTAERRLPLRATGGVGSPFFQRFHLNGVAGSTLALMDAVPISKPVSGAAMGLIKEENEVRVLTDIQALKTFWETWTSKLLARKRDYSLANGYEDPWLA